MSKRTSALDQILACAPAADRGTRLQPLMGHGMLRHFRPIFRGTLIANVNMDGARVNDLVAEGLAGLVAFGRPNIANPDLVGRLKTGAPLAEIDWSTV